MMDALHVARLIGSFARHQQTITGRPSSPNHLISAVIFFDSASHLFITGC